MEQLLVFKERSVNQLYSGRVYLLALKTSGLPLKLHLFHRIVEWFVLEGTLQTIQFQPPCHQQGHLPPDQVAQSPIQPGLENCQGGGSHSCSEQPVPVARHPHSKEFLSYI